MTQFSPHLFAVREMVADTLTDHQPPNRHRHWRGIEDLLWTRLDVGPLFHCERNMISRRHTDLDLGILLTASRDSQLHLSYRLDDVPCTVSVPIL